MYTVRVLVFAAVGALSSAGYLGSGSEGHHREGHHERDHHGGYSAGDGYEGRENYGPPQPYQFEYTSKNAEGTHGHSQSSDGRRVQGHYVIQLADGRQRMVKYYADETGFHAKVMTNELGTQSKNPADALFDSSAITGEEAALQYGFGQKVSYRGHHGGHHGSQQ
ncbi:cuticle protein 10.9-like [Tropilaelaps mercedesae]|uniref:Cuticle protein 10.9-like n=1 Tax=Tropilaelaps mercedesae TaxID=418985 RepID=A0A1V9X229_9ACAR|nr:cuticle protein 10.9-like [Tropilaelaps mercedesae]